MLFPTPMVREQRFEEGSCFCYRSSASCCWRKMVAVITCNSCLGLPGIETAKAWSKINGRKASWQAGKWLLWHECVAVCQRWEDMQVAAAVRQKGSQMGREGWCAGKWQKQEQLTGTTWNLPSGFPIDLLVESHQGRLQIAMRWPWDAASVISAS